MFYLSVMKENILTKSRLLYNKLGLRKVTSRMICESLNISLGSFSYHFPDKKVIISSLYEELQKELQILYSSIQSAEPDIIDYLEMSEKKFQIQEKYKFIYLNLFEILTQDENIRKSYLQNNINERKIAKSVFNYYMKAGILRKDIDNNQIERLINTGQIVNNFWLIDATISSNLKKSKKLSHYMKICCGILEAYLAPSSLKKYNDYFKRINESI